MTGTAITIDRGGGKRGDIPRMKRHDIRADIRNCSNLSLYLVSLLRIDVERFCRRGILHVSRLVGRPAPVFVGRVRRRVYERFRVAVFRD